MSQIAFKGSNKVQPKISYGVTSHHKTSQYKKINISLRQKLQLPKLQICVAADTEIENKQTDDQKTIEASLKKFKQYFSERAKLIDEELSKSVPDREPQVVTEAMRYSLLAGGKRIRPGLCLATCEAVGGDMKSAIPTACALEMIHTMSLIHDDLPALDNDDLRRGVPTSHKVFGEDMAVLAGDALLALSAEVIARDTQGAPAERVLQVLCEVQQAVRRMVDGQVLDIKSEGKKGVTLEELQQIHDNKTAALLEGAVVSGAILGMADTETVEKLRVYSKKIGLAFQVVDDILDVTGSSEELGKTAAKDIQQDKATYPKILGLEQSKKVARELIDDALKQLEGFDQEKVLPLQGLALYILHRKS